MKYVKKALTNNFAIPMVEEQQFLFMQEGTYQAVYLVLRKAISMRQLEVMR